MVRPAATSKAEPASDVLGSGCDLLGYSDQLTGVVVSTIWRANEVVVSHLLLRARHDFFVRLHSAQTLNVHVLVWIHAPRNGWADLIVSSYSPCWQLFCLLLTRAGSRLPL